MLQHSDGDEAEAEVLIAESYWGLCCALIGLEGIAIMSRILTDTLMTAFWVLVGFRRIQDILPPIPYITLVYLTLPLTLLFPTSNCLLSTYTYTIICYLY